MRNLSLGISAGALIGAWQSYQTQPGFACACVVIGVGLLIACRTTLYPAIGKDS